MPEVIPTGSEFTVTERVLLVDGFSAHAAMVDTLDPAAPAVPSVLLDLEGTLVGDLSGQRINVRVLLERPGAEGLVAGLANSVTLLENIRRNQEGPN